MEICCRICRRKELDNFFSLNFQSDFHSQTGETVLEMLSDVTRLCVSLDDTLPQQICRVCTGTLVALYEFKRMCIESDRFFRQSVQSEEPNALLAEKCLFEGEMNPCLTVEDIKLEPLQEAEDTRTCTIESDSNFHNNDGSADRFYCCFPNCKISYHFEELLTEHAESDHQLEKEANTANCNDNDFCCIVCSKAFVDEITLLQYRAQINTESQKSSTSLSDETAGEKEAKVRYRKRPQISTDQSSLANLPLKTNEEIIALGFSYMNNITILSCCVPLCATVCETQQQIRVHFQQNHSEIRKANMLKNAHLENSLRCSVCCLSFSTKSALKTHIDDSYGSLFRCNTCRSTNLSKKSAILHSMVPCGGRMHRCSCGYTTPSTFSIKRHLDCMGCPLEGSSLRKIKIKPKFGEECSSNAEMQLKCRNCEQSFISMTSLHRHMESELSRALAKQESRNPIRSPIDIANNQYTCSWCNAVTDNSNHLVQCMIKAEKENGETDQHRCSVCEQYFKNYNKFLAHNGSCKPKNSMCCKLCGIKFPTYKLLIRHLANIHKKFIKPKIKRFECTVCHMLLASTSSLNRHRRTLHNLGNP